MALCRIAPLDQLLDLDLCIQSCLVELIKLGQYVLGPNDLILGMVALELMKKANHIVMRVLEDAILIQ
jgi:hypothetical protein